MTPENKDALRLKKTLTYANGYRELGMFKAALEELSQLPENLSDRLEGLQMRLAILIDAKDWASATCTAKTLVLREPTEPTHLVNLAFVTRRSQSLGEAKTILADAAQRFPKIGIIHYNLGCYACQEQDLESAKIILAKAFSLDPSFLNTAKTDEDLIVLQFWLKTLKTVK
jgi:tetratricopeptide (TPR) repeat protein|tara:strand:- start:1378 stop:1890 length:513 start_codon:yes stop_codon:yes gene_type:complete